MCGLGHLSLVKYILTIAPNYKFDFTMALPHTIWNVNKCGIEISEFLVHKGASSRGWTGLKIKLFNRGNLPNNEDDQDLYLIEIRKKSQQRVVDTLYEIIIHDILHHIILPYVQFQRITS